MGKKQKQPHVSRSERYGQIVLACLVIEARGARPTIASIAKHLNLAASSHLRKMVNELTRENQNPYLDKLSEVHWNGRTRFVYMPNHTALQKNCSEWYNEKVLLLKLNKSLAIVGYEIKSATGE